MIIRLNNLKFRIGWAELLYIFVILFFIVLVSKDLAYNTAFVDEAIYATVGEEALRGSFWERGLSWMGGSYLYPVISATINRAMGLYGVRLFSVFCVFVAIVVSGELAKYIANRKARLLTVFILATSGIALNMSQLGTYDAPALLFFSLSYYLALLSRKQKRLAIIFVSLSSLLFVFSVLSKYIAVLFAPAILLAAFDFEWKRFFNSVVWIAIAAFGIGLFGYLNFESLKIFFTGSAFKEPTTHLQVIKDTYKYLGIVAPLSVFGALLVFLRKRKHMFVLLSIIAGSMAPFSYHFVFLNGRSLWKHLLFSEVLLAPLVSYLFLLIYKKIKILTGKKVYLDNASLMFISLTLLVTVLIIRNNFKNHWIFQRSWPSASPSIEFLSKNRKDDDIILAEGSAVYKYHLFAGFQNPNAWASTWYMEYKGLSGLNAMELAIKEKHFDFVILNGYFTGDIVYELKPLLNEYYQIAHTDSYMESGAYERETFVWVPKGTDREYFGLN